MGKKKTQSAYNDYLDGEKLRDNSDIRTTLQTSSPATRDISPPPVRQDRRNESKRKGNPGPKRPPLTHFLCLPLLTETSRPQLQNGLQKLKDELIRDAIVPPQAVRPVGSLHLTLGVMSLSTPDHLEEAKQFLQSMNLHALLRDISMQKLAEQAAEDGTIAENMCAVALPDTDALTVSLDGLVPMQGAGKTSILYAEPRDKSARLMGFAEGVRERFVKCGLLVEDTRALKLHATLVNTVYAKRGGRRGKGKYNGDGGGESAKKLSTLDDHEAEDTHDQDDQASTTGSMDDNPPTSSTQTRTSKEIGHGPETSSWLRFDARPLIASYKHFVWADEVRVDKVQICKMGAKKIWSGGKEGDGEVVDERYEVVCERGIYE